MTDRSAIAADLIRTRRTIHSFKPELPPRDTILQAIDLAHWAPNHRLTEPWRFYLLGRETAEAVARLNAEQISRIKGAQAAHAKLQRWRTMPGWLVVTCENSDDPVRSREDYASCCCAIHNFALYLWSEGIGVKWNTGAVTRDPAFYDLISADPQVETMVAMLWYGYPAEIPRMQRKPVTQMIVELA